MTARYSRMSQARNSTACPQHNQCDANIHVIAHVAVQPLDDQSLGRGDWSGSAIAANGESPEGRVHVDGESDGDQNNSRPAQSEAFGSLQVFAQPPGNPSRHAAWHQD